MNEISNMIDENDNLNKREFIDFFLELFDLLSFLILVAWIVLIVKFFIFNPYTVVWQSMEPTFDDKDFIFVDKVTPRFYDYKRWDVIVFVPPWKDIPYIKRIVWLPWELIKISSWNVYVCNKEQTTNCQQIKEDYLPNWTKTKAACEISQFYVETWNYLVFWDNRDHSTDSRCCFWLWCFWSWKDYLLPQKYIIWKVYIRLFPNFNKF